MIWIAFLPLSFLIATLYIVLRSALDAGSYGWNVQARYGRVWTFWKEDVHRYLRFPDVEV